MNHPISRTLSKAAGLTSRIGRRISPTSFRRAIVPATVALVVIASGLRAGAQTLDIDTANGNSPYTVGSSASYAGITVGDTVAGVLNQSANTLTSTVNVVLGNGTLTTGIYNLAGGTLSDTAGTLTIGNYGAGTLTASNAASVSMSGKTIYLGNFASGSGTLVLNNSSSLLASTIYVGNSGGVGTILQNSSSSLNLTISHSIDLGYSTGSKGTYTMTGGTTTLLSLFAGYSGAGTATISGGVVNLSGALNIAAAASSATGLVNISGGSLNVITSTTPAYIGYNGSGTLNISSGSLNSAANVDLGYLNSTAVGTLIISDGYMNTTTTTAVLNVGSVGTGAIVQSGGTISLAGTSPAVFGLQSTAVGTMSLSGGIFNASAGGINVGSSGTGTITQSNGTLYAGATGLTLGVSAGGKGTYTLSGGTLITGGIAGGSGASTLNFNGGTIQLATTSGTISGITTANIQAGGAVFNTAAGTLTISQSLLHDPSIASPALDGGLTQAAVGTLVFSGNNTYTGGTTINAGAIRANGTISSLGTGTIAVNSGGLLGGNGTITNGTNPLTINSGGTITAGPDASTVGTLTTGSETWTSNGIYAPKLAAGTTTSDQLVLTSLTVSATSGSTFIINVTGTGAGAATQKNYVLAVDQGVSSGDPFKLGVTGRLVVGTSSLKFELNGGTPTGGYYLSEGPDTTGLGGYDLFFNTPEPTSLALTIVPAVAMLGRRRGRKNVRPIPAADAA